MSKDKGVPREHQIVFSDGKRGVTGDFPIAVVWEQPDPHSKQTNLVVDPIFDYRVRDNLYGRVMTLLEATVESPQRLQAIKNLFGKELTQWSSDVYRSAQEIAEGGGSSNNIYSRPLPIND